MLDSPTSSAALYLGQRGGPGGPPRMAREAPAGFAPVDAAPWRPAVPPLPVLAELVAAFPSAEARLVVVGAGDLGMAAYRDCLHAASTSLDVAALVTTGGAAAAEARATLGRDVTVLVPDRPEDIWRTAGEFAGRLARRTSAPVILQCPDGLVTYAALDLLAEQGVRGVVASAGCSTAGYAARPLRPGRRVRPGPDPPVRRRHRRAPGAWSAGGARRRRHRGGPRRPARRRRWPGAPGSRGRAGDGQA